MEYTNEQLKDVQRVETGILKAFDEVARKLNLAYFICAGTLIGAIRHKGFIPWDDDIDVLMPRADYEKFIREGQALLPDEYFFQTYQTVKEYPRTYGKLCDSRTTFVEGITRNYKINHGAFIDVFPLDYYPDDQKTVDIINRKKKTLLRSIDKNFYRSDAKAKFCNFIKKILYLCPARVAVKKLDNIFKSVEKSTKLVNYMSMYGEREVFPVEYFADTIDVEFEGLKVKAPKEYHKILTQIYGDYMKLPPEDKRITHHNFVVVDMNKPYKEYNNK